ncbi:MAG TPA: NAD-dependent epimerase/dehydratase family protein [Candidatus Udaeobacter sp.]|jgi:nucleoside-diphosphate-sugar epimerase|nr:NAD-dependent epimerase/dehydratase family protein [Candidatus Udaeobacter sp.]
MTSARRILVLGGSGFIGAHAVRALVTAGWDVTSLSRGGETPAPGVATLRADRRDVASLTRALEGARFDATLDCCAYDSADVERLWLVPHAALGRYLLISSGQVYLVTEDPRAASDTRAVAPAEEAESERPVMREPAHGTRDHAEWSYGVGKRRAESAALALRASHGVRSVILRLPIIHGSGDPKLRLWAYVQRIQDGGPLVLPDGGRQLTRYLWVEDVGRAVRAILDQANPEDAVFNLAQPDVVTLREFLERVAGLVDPKRAKSATRWIDVSAEELEREGLDPSASPLSGHWSSLLDPARAAGEWGFTGTRLDEWLPAVVRDLIDHPPPKSHPGYASRAREIEIAKRAAASPA